MQLTDNLNQRVLPGQGVVNVSAEWKDLGLMSHSLGADSLVQMLQRNHTVAKVTIKLLQYEFDFQVHGFCIAVKYLQNCI